MIDESWNQLIRSLPGCHFLQTRQWAEVKKEIGWQSKPLVWKDSNNQVVAAANLLIRRMRLFSIGPAISIGYIPRGPMMDWSDASLRQRVIHELELIARSENLIFLKIDPEIVISRGVPGSDTEEDEVSGNATLKDVLDHGWRLSHEQIQFKNTAVLDLGGCEEDWLARMKQKTRYNLRVSQRSGVAVRVASDHELSQLYQMYAQTANRDGFIIREMDYYLKVWRSFILADMAVPLIAEVDGEAVAGLILFHLGTQAWYFYGMSTNRHREKMPNYLLQWEAMRLAARLGCKVYDLRGAPDVFDPADRMYGVFRFKEGLGATVIRTAGALDLVIKPTLYYVYQQLLPRFLNFTRSLRRKKIQKEIN